MKKSVSNISLWVFVLLLLGGVVFYATIDPTKHFWIPQCPFRLLTGWSCPACGVQRALHALLNGRFAEALSYNYLFIFSIPYVTVLIVAEGLKLLGRGERFIRAVNHPVLARVYVVLFVVWGVVRNILGM